ncbi:MAG: SPFH domain-containing protein [Euryarchaeota archaeon]|nr:SPFH domain-containing protein [Euryarchaeota archaeon]
MEIILGLFAFVALALIALAAASIRIVRPYEKGLIERLGRYQRAADSGLTLIVPVIEHMKKIDMREIVVDVPPQEVITEDNVVVTVDAVVYYQIMDPVKVEYNIENFRLAATKLAQTNLRNVVGDLELDETLTSREKINVQLREILDDATDKWGVKVSRVELQRIDPPHDVTEAMHRQMKAERERRARILEADGRKQAAIRQAEGKRKAMILEAEGEAEAIKKVADATKYEKVIVAEGEAEAIEDVFSSIHTGDPTNDLVAIKYLETLSEIAKGKANKVFLPYEATGLMGSIGGIAELFKEKSEKTTTKEPEEEKTQEKPKKISDLKKKTLEKIRKQTEKP